MLPYVLAWVVGLGSLTIYLAAFFFPEIHRKNDFIWSGVGLFYALILWIYAGRLTGGLLLGETAGVALLCWLGWQTLTLRRQQIPLDQQTPLPDTTALQERLSSLTRQLQERLGTLSQTPVLAEKPAAPAKTEEVLEVAEEIAEIEEKLDAAVAESIAAAQAEANSSQSEAKMVLPSPTTAERSEEVKPQVPIEKPPTQTALPVDLAQMQGRASQALSMVKEALQGLPKLLKPKSKSKPVWVRPAADQPAAANQEAASEAPILAREEKVAEAPEPLEIPQEVTEGAVSEAEVPTPKQSSVVESPPGAEVEREPGVTLPEAEETPEILADQEAIAAPQATPTEQNHAALAQEDQAAAEEVDVSEEPAEKPQES